MRFLNKLKAKILRRRKLLNHLALVRAGLLFNRLDNNSLFSKGIANLLLHLFTNRQENERYYNYFNKNRTFDHNTLWSWHKSGNHWIRFIAEYLTGCPTSGGVGNQKDVPIYLNTFPSEEHPLSHVNPKAPFVLYKSHYAYKITSRSAILMIIRDYHEIISRPPNIRELVDEAFMYLNLIASYARFSGNKMIIYYEDLLTYSEREISRIKYFLNASDERFQTFMNNYDYYAELSKQGENRAWYGYHSSSDLRFHQKKLSKKNLLTRKNFLQAMLATKQYQCAKPYIARYE